MPSRRSTQVVRPPARCASSSTRLAPRFARPGHEQGARLRREHRRRRRRRSGSVERRQRRRRARRAPRAPPGWWPAPTAAAACAVVAVTNVGDRVDEVLAVVEHQQQLLALEEARQSVGDRHTVRRHVAHRGRDGVGQVVGIVHLAPARRATRRRDSGAATRSRPAAPGGSCPRRPPHDRHHARRSRRGRRASAADPRGPRSCSARRAGSSGRRRATAAVGTRPARRARRPGRACTGDCRSRSRCSPRSSSAKGASRTCSPTTPVQRICPPWRPPSPGPRGSLGAEPVAVALGGLARVHSHPDPQLHAVGPLRRHAAPAAPPPPRPRRRPASRTRPWPRRRCSSPAGRRGLRPRRATARRGAPGTHHRSGRSSHRRVEPSRSVNRNVSVCPEPPPMAILSQPS